MSSNSHDPVVTATELSKVYQVYNHPRDRLLQSLWRNKRQYYKEFWALQPVSFTLDRGTTLGVVGRNGSGKSTLLQLICGTLRPSTGSVMVDGRIAALLELGSGFNLEFNGRENVYLNATLLGLNQSEIDERLDDILSFADIGEFIDQPVKTYSSGMAVRLAFAVQAHIDPDLLVVDEALAVGDELFQKKCYSHLERLKERGSSVILVTHSCPQIIQHCDQALLLHKGKSRLWGKPSRVTILYQRLINASDQEWEDTLDREKLKLDYPIGSDGPAAGQKTTHQPDHDNSPSSEPTSADPCSGWFDPDLKPDSTVVYPDRGVRIEGLRIETLGGEPMNVFPMNEPFVLSFNYYADEDLFGIAFGCHIADHKGLRITGQTYPGLNGCVEQIAGHSSWTIKYTFDGRLWPGIYFVGGGIWSEVATKADADMPRFLHRVVDFAAIRILSAQPINSIGVCNLRLADPQFNLLA